ncbi:hypothetical protein PMI16_02133 [Herbaspirillum sp. CF444]|uniref:hypothetical protein n=1 Tax=Herbaspirillum sp. CF444 TaxID=1144319 RepID=UPI00027268C8|nr:hypothetical protein [Herbaspirillum sp. CF444]EJL88985.1 hypothetical protein PMI16_02133 [Herbaspirillum sp. CF444]
MAGPHSTNGAHNHGAHNIYGVDHDAGDRTHQDNRPHGRSGISGAFHGLINRIAAYNADSLSGIMGTYLQHRSWDGSGSGKALDTGAFVHSILDMARARLSGIEDDYRAAVFNMRSVVDDGVRQVQAWRNGEPTPDDAASLSSGQGLASSSAASSAHHRARASALRNFRDLQTHVPEPPPGMTPWQADDPDAARMQAEPFNPYEGMSEEEQRAAREAEEQMAYAGQTNALHLLGGQAVGNHPRRNQPHGPTQPVEPDYTEATPSSAGTSDTGDDESSR